MLIINRKKYKKCGTKIWDLKVLIQVNLNGFVYLFVSPFLPSKLLMYQIRYIFFIAASVKNSILHDNEKFDNWPQLNKWSTIFCEKATFVCMHIICKQTQEQKTLLSWLYILYHIIDIFINTTSFSFLYRWFSWENGFFNNHKFKTKTSFYKNKHRIYFYRRIVMQIINKRTGFQKWYLISHRKSQRYNFNINYYIAIMCILLDMRKCHCCFTSLLIPHSPTFYLLHFYLVFCTMTRWLRSK